MQQIVEASRAGRNALSASRSISRRPAGRRSPADAGRVRRFLLEQAPADPVVVDRRVSTFVVPDDLAPYPDVEAITPLGHPHHFRVQGAGPQIAGQYEFCGLEDGFFICIHDSTCAVPLASTVLAENMVRVRVASESDGEYAARGSVLDLEGPGASIIIEPPDQPPAELVVAGSNVAAEIFIHRDRLRDLYAGDDDELPGVLRAFLAGRLEQTFARRLPLGPQLLRCAEDLTGCALGGRGRRLLIRSKAVEILCHVFALLAQDESGESAPEASRFAAQGVVKAQRLLEANFVSPPSLDDLAQQVGLSRSGLCAAFRQIAGQSVFDYVVDLRMQHALALLCRSDATISEVAYAVGYGHPSSFSVAVQRRFGTTASELRRRGAPSSG